MTGLLLTRHFLDAYGKEVEAAAAGVGLELIAIEDEVGSEVEEGARGRIELAFLSGDLYPGNFRGFLNTVRQAPNLRWLHVFYVGVDERLYGPFLERGVRLTNSAGASGEVIAQTAIAGLLMLARGMLRWQEAQRRRAWEQVFEGPETPRDLKGQTMVVVGVGAIGGHIARLGQALGLRVIGVRRSPASDGDPVDRMVHPSELDTVLPQADWLALATPLSDETRGLIDARRLALLPEGARILNVARGAVIDEAAMVQALASGRLGGAYLDVFTTEPLPPESPLWTLPNVIVTPHNSTATSGKYEREARLFLDNLSRWLRAEALANEVTDF
jgi:D-2-hydroxyacid dehydrogenase (NADP+)